MWPSTRCIKLGRLFVNTVSQAGIVQAGDSGKTELTAKALAVQRANSIYYGDEFRFASYSIFNRVPQTIKLNREVELRYANQPDICVGTIETLGVTASSILRIGCGGPLSSEVRIKHIRQFNNGVDC